MNKLKYALKSLLYKFLYRFQIDDIKITEGIILSKLNNQSDQLLKLEDAEFKVFSQFGDDGIIDYLINKLPIDNKFFIEFGVGDYMESNTRFLLMKNNWTGFVMDGSKDNINLLKKSYFYWKFDLNSKAVFITRDNINKLLSDGNVPSKVGLLHIDLDGNDYHIWEIIYML